MALALLAAFGTSARTIEEIRKGGKMLVATEGQFAPFNFFVGNKLTGFEIELTELIAKKMGVTLEWKALSFDALLAGFFGMWEQPKGPPFGILPEELDTLLTPNFERIEDSAVDDSIAVFAGRERWQVWRRK